MYCCIAILLTITLWQSSTASLTCKSLDLLCPGTNPTAFSWSVNQSRIGSKDGSAYIWKKPGVVDTSLTSSITCQEYTSGGTGYLLIRSSGIPNHNIGKFPFNVDTDGNGHNDNPNTIQAQSYQWKILKNPALKARAPSQNIMNDQTQLPMGPIGFALNGVPFFNPFNKERLDAVNNQSKGYEVMDLCMGHPQMNGAYHYHHQGPKKGCLFTDTPGQHSPKIGYSFDGVPVYGPLSDNGIPPTDLDICNGRTHPTLGYIYHLTLLKAPYIIGCYRYKVTDTVRGPSSIRLDNGQPVGSVEKSCSLAIGLASGATKAPTQAATTAAATTKRAMTSQTTPPAPTTHILTTIPPTTAAPTTPMMTTKPPATFPQTKLTMQTTNQPTAKQTHHHTQHTLPMTSQPPPATSREHMHHPSSPKPRTQNPTTQSSTGSTSDGAGLMAHLTITFIVESTNAVSYAKSNPSKWAGTITSCISTKYSIAKSLITNVKIISTQNLNIVTNLNIMPVDANDTMPIRVARSMYNMLPSAMTCHFSFIMEGDIMYISFVNPEHVAVVMEIPLTTQPSITNSGGSSSNSRTKIAIAVVCVCVFAALVAVALVYARKRKLRMSSTQAGSHHYQPLKMELEE